MQKINLNDETIENIAKINADLQRGTFGTVARIDRDLAIKFYNGFLTGYKEKSVNEISKETTIFVPQIEILTKKQKDLKLTTLPLGVAYYHDVPVGVIIKYFEKHKTLLELYKENYTVIISIFQKILNIVNEQIVNGIFQRDIKEDNFLYSTINYNAQAIDLDGVNVDFYRENIPLEEMMYETLLDMFIFLSKEKLLFDYNNNNLDESEYKERVEAVKELKFGIYVFEGLQAFINGITRGRILEPSQKILKK